MWKNEEISYLKRTQSKSEFSEYFLIWKTLNEIGIISQQALNSTDYLNECINVRLLSSLNEHYKNDDVLFWLNITTRYHVSQVKSFIRTQNIDFIKQHENTQNVSQVRVIETFLTLCKIYFKNNKPESLEECGL